MKRRSFLGRLAALLAAAASGAWARLGDLGRSARRLAGRVSRAPADLMERMRARTRRLDPDEPLGPSDLAG